ncbi:hypothetical protein PV721_41665, partial [Streptomyces sp. MB09-01]|uniref:hypothetical protein n=1 Tax=Streptomyces sp. MB09-01 TaxID=3028666 RepID=UPI0029ABF73E
GAEGVGPLHGPEGACWSVVCLVEGADESDPLRGPGRARRSVAVSCSVEGVGRPVPLRGPGRGR